MAYVPSAYTTLTAVKRILRTFNNKIKIGDNPNDTITEGDVTEYILDASRFMDSMLMKIITSGLVPLSDTYAEISYAAPRLTAFLIYRDIYQAYRQENLPMGPRGWIEDAKDMIKVFIDNINEGVYPTLSPSTNAPTWTSVEQFFINKFGVSSVHTEVGTAINEVASISDDNSGPWD